MAYDVFFPAKTPFGLPVHVTPVPAGSILFLVRYMRALLASFAMAVLLAGCSLHEWREYDINAASHTDVHRVQEIMQHVAAESGISRHFGGSYSPNQPIANYLHDKVQFVAFVDRGEIRIWLMRDDWPPPPAFTEARRLVEPALASAFGSRFSAEQQPVHIVYTDR